MGKVRYIRRMMSVVVASCMLFMTVGCGTHNEKLVEKADSSEIQISLWTDEATAPIIEKQLEEFKELHKDEANLVFSVSVEITGNCRDTVLSNPQGAADLFTMADDQVKDLYRNGVLLEITENREAILGDVGGADSAIAQIMLQDGKMYAYPETASNGYFLYYNKAYFGEEDIQSLDHILEICKKNHKLFMMDYSSGWYTYSFFKGAGLDIVSNEDGTANICNWNAVDTEFTGVDVAEAMLDIAKNEAFVSYGEENFVSTIESGIAIAGINGVWNAEKIAAAWGDNYAAAKLPTYTIKGQQKQMCSFSGYKLMGVNAYTKYPEWCMKVAEYLTNEENIRARCEITGECPANRKAASSDSIQKSVVVRALSEQEKYGYTQNVADTFWKASSKLGIILAAGNLDQMDLQQLLDETQKEIVSSSSER